MYVNDNSAIGFYLSIDIVLWIGILRYYKLNSYEEKGKSKTQIFISKAKRKNLIYAKI